MSVTDRVVPALLRAYKLTVSPLLMALGARCRHAPSCSEYAAQAVLRHGWLRGGAMGLGRVLRCRPGGSQGYDPVPPHRDVCNDGNCENRKDSCAHA